MRKSLEVCSRVSKGTLPAPEELADIVRLPGKVVLSIGCASGSQEFADVFRLWGASANIAPVISPFGHAAPVSVTLLLFALTQGCRRISWHGGAVTRPRWFSRSIGSLENATERTVNNPGRLFWLAPRSWRLNAAFAGANACAAVVLAAMGQMPGAVVSLVAAVAGAAFAWLRWDRQRRLRGRQGRRHPD